MPDSLCMDKSATFPFEYKDGTKTIDDLSKEYNIEIDLLNKYINKLENKNKVINKSYEEKPKPTMMLLFEKMLTIEQKLDDIMLIINRI